MIELRSSALPPTATFGARSDLRIRPRFASRGRVASSPRSAWPAGGDRPDRRPTDDRPTDDRPSGRQHGLIGRQSPSGAPPPGPVL